MTARVHKSFRLDADVARELDRYAESHSRSITSVVEDAIRAYTGRDKSAAQDAAQMRHGEARADDETVAALVAQLEVKDRQISRLMDSLDRAQASVQAAQALEGARVTRALEATAGADADSDDGEVAEGRGTGPLSRFRRWIAGRSER